MQVLKCPNCGNVGEATIDAGGAFEVRGQFEGRAIRKCRSCRAGMAIGPFSGGLFGKPKLIPKEIWQKMEQVWGERFGDD